MKLAQTMNPNSDNNVCDHLVVINEAIIQKQAETMTNSPNKIKNQSEIIKLALQTLKPKLIED